jgi:hypothetical protein
MFKKSCNSACFVLEIVYWPLLAFVRIKPWFPTNFQTAGKVPIPHKNVWLLRDVGFPGRNKQSKLTLSVAPSLHKVTNIKTRKFLVYFS